MTQNLQEPREQWRDTLREVAKNLRADELLEELFNLIQNPAPVTFVGHRHPDDDVLVCFFIAKMHMPIIRHKEVRFVFVNAGESFEGSGETILHFDTGRGEYDQHGKEFVRTSSAQILAERIGVQNDPGLKPLLEMATATDNVEPVSLTSIHFILEGYPNLFRKEDGKTDWDKVIERSFELFRIIYGQERQRTQSREQLRKYARWIILPNGLKVAEILGRPQLREAAFEQGAAVAIWTQSFMRNMGEGKVYPWPEFERAKRVDGFHEEAWERVFYTGIQTNRNMPLYLDKVAADLALAESRKRREALNHVAGVWFLHGSKKLILNGSRAYEPKKDELTVLAPYEIAEIVEGTLSRIPGHITSRWMSTHNSL